MLYKKLGKTGEKIPHLGLGTWKIPEGSVHGRDALVEGLKLGATLVDTAEMYANENIVGEAIRLFGGDVFLMTKVSPHHFRHDDVIRACEASLSRLKVKSIDLYQLHWPNHSIPISETMGAMEELVERGKIRHIGVSNFDEKELIEAQEAMRKYEVVSNQIEYSLSVREPEKGLLQFCEKEGITVFAYSPLSRGRVLDKKFVDVFDGLSKKYKASTAQIALNYLARAKGVVPIPKSGDLEHTRENVHSLDFELGEADIRRIDSLSGSGKPLAGRALSAFLKNTGAWSKAMEAFERRRKK